MPTADAVMPAEQPAAQAQPSGVVGSSAALGEQALQVSPDRWIWNWNCRDSPTGIPQLAGSLGACASRELELELELRRRKHG